MEDGLSMKNRKANVMREYLRRTKPLAALATRRQLLNLLNDRDNVTVYRIDRLSRDEHVRTTLVLQLETMGVALVVTPETQGDSDEK